MLHAASSQLLWHVTTLVGHPLWEQQQCWGHFAASTTAAAAAAEAQTLSLCCFSLCQSKCHQTGKNLSKHPLQGVRTDEMCVHDAQAHVNAEPLLVRPSNPVPGWLQEQESTLGANCDVPTTRRKWVSPAPAGAAAREPRCDCTPPAVGAPCVG